jgi:aryl-alcohol dehydrogenase-like predicted oxidoreductase
MAKYMNRKDFLLKTVSGKRKEVVIQTKIRLDGSELSSKGKGKKGALEIRNNLSSSLEASLKALDTNYIDIVLYHDASDENLLFHSETMKYFDELKKAGIIRAHGFSTHNDCMNLLIRNNVEGFYDVIMVPFNHKGAFTHSVTGSYSEWDQEKLIGILAKASQKGKGIIAMKSCSAGPYSTSSGSVPNYQDPVKWVIQHEFISSAAIAMVNFEQVNDHLPLFKVNL